MNMPSRTTVTLDHISKSYGHTTALDDIDLELGAGITGLLGPNGAGKTTMLRILATALAPDRGELSVLGEDPAGSAGRVAVRRRLGYVPQETGFPRGFTAFAFVDYMAILKEWDDATSRHTEVRRVLDLVGLGDVATKRVSALSGGQRRRVVLAQAMLGLPALLILDEPTAGPGSGAARKTPRRAQPGRRVGHGPHLHPPDRRRGGAVRAGDRPRRRAGAVRRRGDGDGGAGGRPRLDGRSA